MDPLSTTASIIAILELASTLTNYVIDASNANTDQKRLAVEASNLSSLLTTLRFRVEGTRTDDPWYNQVKLLGIKNGPLDQLKDIFETMVGQSSSSRNRDQIKSALLWKFTKKEVENVLGRMERLKSLINCALINDLMTLSKGIHDDVANVKEQTKQLHSRIDWLQTLADPQLQKRLSRWLGLPDPSTNYHAALQKRHPESGLWLINGQDFLDWKSSTSSLMWLHGNPGCGKTVLSAATLQHILEQQKSQPHMMVSYFYFDFNDVEKQSSRKAIRSLLFQLALQDSGILEDLENLYEKCASGQQQPAESVIRSLFMEATARSGQNHIILDALDECSDREELLTFLRALMDSTPRDLYVFATSRPLKDIEEELSSITNHNIKIQSATVDADIRVYIRDLMATDQRLKKWPPSVQTEITIALIEKASGMFRWVYCQLQSIRHCIKLSAIRKTLSSLPETLDETYNRIIHALKSTGQLQDAIKALRWLCFSTRPLQLAEMVEILAIENGDQGGFSPEERMPDPTDVMTVCSSLICLNPNNLQNGSGEDGHRILIQLAHFSVKEFLLSNRCDFELDFQPRICHLAIAESCLHYLLHLCRNMPLTKELINQYPLSVYAAKQWWRHIQSITGVLDDTFLDLASNLLMKENHLLSWIQLYDMDRSWQRFDPSFKTKDLEQPLYYAAHIGVPAVVERIMARSFDVNAQGGNYGNALQAASYRGHGTVVKMLLDAGADVNLQGGEYDNALQAASYRGHGTVVKMLLNARADINAQGGSHDNALYTASFKGHDTVVKILLDAGADVNTQGGYYGNALQAASLPGHDTVVKILVDGGADINAQGGEYDNALQAASYGGHRTIVKMLLNAGADANAQGGYYGNALQAASVHGYGIVVKMLVDNGANVNTRGGNFGDALYIASYGGHGAVVTILLDAGADIKTQGGHYGNALQAALSQGHDTVVKILVDRGADINAQGSDDGDTLQTAIISGYEAQVLKPFDLALLDWEQSSISSQ